MKDIYCVKCIKVTPHKGEVDQNGEFIFHCQTEGCEMFVKFPQVQGGEELNKLIADREEANKAMAEGRQAHDEANKILSEVLGDGTNVTVTEEAEEPAPTE